MVLSCSLAIVALFIVELNSTLYQGLPTDMSVIPVENHELVVSGVHPQGSTIDSSFNSVHILHVQDDPAYNPYFALNNQSRTLQSKVEINPIQGNTSYVGTFLMAVNKQNQSEVNTLYCVTYCIGKLTEPSIHEACYDSVSLGESYVTVNESLLSQHVYESNISQHASIGHNVLQLSLTPGNKSNVTFAVMECSSKLFFVDDRGVLRTLRQLLEEDIAIHVLKIATLANNSDEPQLELALVTVKVIEVNTFPPIFEEPDGYTFSVKEGEQGLSVGFVKAVDHDVGLSGKVVYSFKKQQDAILFELNSVTGEIKTAKALDRETAESHVFTAVAANRGVPKSSNSEVEVRVAVEDINDNRPIFANKEAKLVLITGRQPGLILSLKAEDKDIGKNAKMVYMITQGNDRNLFRINSTSGELFLVATLTVTTNDSIVLVVSAVDMFSTNSSFQDTTVVKMTFYDVTFLTMEGSSVALTYGASVGGLFIVITAAFSLWLWKRQRHKSQVNRREYKAKSVIYTDQTPFEYERKIYTVGDTARRSSFEIYPPRRSSIEIYPPLKDAPRSPGTPQDSQISLDLSTIEYALYPLSLVSIRPSVSHSAPSSPEQELGRSRGSHVSLDLTEMKSQSLSAPPSPRKKTEEWRYRSRSQVSLDFSQVEPEFLSSQQAPMETSEISLSQTETRASTSKRSEVSLDLSCVEPDLAAREYESQSMSLALSEDSPKPSSSAKGTTSSIAETSQASTEESKLQFIPPVLIQRSESVRKSSLKPQESVKFESTPTSSKQSLGSALSEDSPKPPSSAKETTSSIAKTSQASTEESELQFIPPVLIQRSESVHNASLETQESVKFESTPTSSKQSVGSALSEDSPKSSSSAKGTTSSIAKTSQASTEESELQLIPPILIQRSESVRKASLKPQESVKFESTPTSSKQSLGSALSEDSPKPPSSAKETTSSIAKTSQASTEESELQFIPPVLIQRSESVCNASLETQESVKFESTPTSSKQSVGSALSEDSPKSSSSAMGTTSSIAKTSQASTEESELQFIPPVLIQRSESVHNASLETQESVKFESTPTSSKQSLGSALSEDSPKSSSSAKGTTSSIAKTSQASTEESELQFIPPVLTQRSESVRKASLKPQESVKFESTPTSSKQSLGSAVSEDSPKPPSSAKETTSSIAKTSQASTEESELQFIPPVLIQRSESVCNASLETQESVKFESAPTSSKQSLGSALSEDSPKSSSSAKGTTSNIAETSQASTEESELQLIPQALIQRSERVRKASLEIQESVKDESTPTSSKQSLGSALMEDSPKPPPSAKRTISSFANTSQASTEKSEIQFIPQKGSSDDSDDTTQEPETSTPRKRFPWFRRKKKTSSSRGQTTRRDSLPQTESGVLPVPSTQQENATVITDQSVITDRFPCTTELDSRQVTGDETLAEGSIDVGNDNGEKLEKTSSRLSDSGESVIRSKYAPIESKEIEEFENEDNINLSRECAEYSVSVMDDSNNSFAEISGSSREDIRPLLQSKSCVVLSDSNIQVCEESTSSTLAATTSSVSHPLASSGYPPSLQLSERRAASTSSLNRKRAVESTAPSQTSGSEESEIQFTPQALIQRSESARKASPKNQESAAVMTESAQVSLELGRMERDSQLTSPSSSEDSHTDLNLTRDVASSTSSIDTYQGSSEEYFSADESFSLKNLQFFKADALEQIAKYQSRGVELSPPGSFQDDSLPLHQRSNEDLGKCQSPYTKLKPVQSKIARIPLKGKKAFKFSTSEKQHKLYSKFRKKGSSDDSDDTTQEPETTPLERFVLSGRKKKKSSSWEDVRPFLQSKPCVVLSDSNIQVCGESISSTLAATTSSVSHPLAPSGYVLPLQLSKRRAASTSSLNRKRAVESTAPSQTSGFEESEIQYTPQTLIQRSESARKALPKNQESAAVMTESAQVSLELGRMEHGSQLTSPSSSEDSHTDLNLTRDVASSTSSIDTYQGSSEEYFSADESFSRKNLQFFKADALERIAKYQSRGVELSPLGSFQDDSLPLHQRSNEDLGKCQSPYTKLKPVKSKIPRIPRKARKVSKFSTSEKQHKLCSKFRQEGSSDDFEDTTQQPETSTPRKRFVSFGPKKKKSSSRGQTTRLDSLPQTELGVLPVPSNQQENAPGTTDQSMITNHPLPLALPSLQSSERRAASTSFFGLRSFFGLLRSSRGQTTRLDSLPQTELGVLPVPSNQQENAPGTTDQSMITNHPLPLALPSLQSCERRAASTSFFGRKRAVEPIAQSQTSDTDPSALHPSLDTSGAERLQHMGPSWSRRDSVEQLSLDETHDNAADVSSSGPPNPEVSSPCAKLQETSHEDFGIFK